VKQGLFLIVEVKKQKPGREGVSEGHRGRSFWSFRRERRLKCSCHPWYGMDIFWNYPIVFNSCLAP